MEELRKLQTEESEDEEKVHIKADKLLCDFLKQLGYDEIVKEYNKIPKWYA